MTCLQATFWVGAFVAVSLAMFVLLSKVTPTVRACLLRGVLPEAPP